MKKDKTKTVTYKLFRVKATVGCSCLFEIVKIKENLKVVTYYHKITRQQHKK